MPTNLTGRVLARLLHLANSNPPFLNRADFYAMKDDILAKHGTPDGTDVQHIVSACWGHWEDPGYQGARCRRCGGTGVYDEKYILLQRWKIGRYTFHSKPERIWKSHYAFKEPSIQGRVEHADYGRKADEAMLWLALLTGHWGLFLNETKATWRYGRKFWPLLNLGCLCWFVHSIYRGLRVYRCHCGRGYRQGWLSKVHWCVCRKCRHSRPEEFPF